MVDDREGSNSRATTEVYIVQLTLLVGVLALQALIVAENHKTIACSAATCEETSSLTIHKMTTVFSSP